jgi:ABC-type transport system substrate-binding protein
VKSPLPVNSLLCAAVLLLAVGCKHKQTPNAPIRIRWAHDPEMLEPMGLHNQAALDAYSLLNISLLQANALQHELTPALAEALPTVQSLNDSTTGISYRIRSGATWDNGRPVLASDVAFTLKVMFCPGLPNEVSQSRYHFIREVATAANDPRRFTLLCRGRSIEYIQETGDFFILPEAELDPHSHFRQFTLADFQRHRAAIAADSGIQAVARRYQSASAPHSATPVPGCGPYRLTHWAPDQYMTFQRKPHWWADSIRPAPFVLQARPQQIKYVIIPDATTAILGLRRGDLDVYPQMPAREFVRLQNTPAARKSLRFYTTDSYDVAIAGFNTRRPALADAPTRQALSHCFNATGLLRATQGGAGQRTVGLVSPADRLNYNDSLTAVPFAPSTAASLLQRAGWHRNTDSGTALGWFRTDARGQRQQLQLAVRYRASDDLFTTVALQFRAAALGIGIPVQLLPTEAGIFSKTLQNGDFDVYIGILRGNPFMFNFTSLLHTAGIGAGNMTGFSSKASDQLIEAIAAAESKPRRAHLLHRFQAMMQEQAPLVPLFFLPNRMVASSSLTGVYANSLKPGYSALTLERIPPPTQ